MGAINSYLKIKAGNSLVWNCPDRANLPAPGLPSSAATGFGSMAQTYIGYAYFGGVSAWANLSPSTKGYSPVKLANAKPFWALGADANFKAGAQWAGAASKVPGNTAYQFEYGSIPPHPNKANPLGGNEVFADGSANWCKFGDMYKFNRLIPSALGVNIDVRIGRRTLRILTRRLVGGIANDEVRGVQTHREKRARMRKTKRERWSDAARAEAVVAGETAAAGPLLPTQPPPVKGRRMCLPDQNMRRNIGCFGSGSGREEGGIKRNLSGMKEIF